MEKLAYRAGKFISRLSRKTAPLYKKRMLVSLLLLLGMFFLWIVYKGFTGAENRHIRQVKILVPAHPPK